MPKRDYSKEEIIDAIFDVISSKTNETIKMQFLHDLCWFWTEFGESKRSKYIGCEYWSKKAIQTWINDSNARLNLRKTFRHDHTIPKKLIIQELLKMKSATRSEINSFMCNFTKATVLTLEEDKQLNKIGLRQKLPAGVTIRNKNSVWARYNATNPIIIPIKVKLNKREIIDTKEVL